MQNAMWPSVALPVSRVPSFERVEVMLSECRGCGDELNAVLAVPIWCGTTSVAVDNLWEHSTE